MTRSVLAELLDGVAVLHVGGEIDITTADPLRAELSTRLAAGDDLVVGCTEVTFMDSTGLSALVTAQNHASRRGTRLIVVGNHHAVLRPLQITHLDAVLTIAATSADALAHLERRDDKAP
ncbi:hypothetical protein BBK82_08240 [Lentzea guizhouensis]|uniref:Anti-sigma factor antagonist n=1 Tax=Lentzea guizhouensis TaxID=1586287 RepID=A0A1B2HXZ6_9PSEU|nr:hypothetical protein BBK82_08240 [Lentzea guizhouensis]